MSKEQFKEFVKNKPSLADYVSSNEMTWQKFYELYDMYGEDESVWSKYPPKSKPKLTDFLTSFDPDSMEKHLDNAEKALNFISELTSKGSESLSEIIKPAEPRPITKFFGD